MSNKNDNLKELKTKYQWKPGTEKTDIDAEQVAVELDRIQQLNDGMLTPNIVVEMSRDRASPLHPCFEWNDKRASGKYRLWQARYLINHIEQVWQYEGGEPIIIRAFTSIVTTGGRGYFRTDVLVKDKDTARIVLENAWAEFHGLKRKYNHLKQFSGIFREMEKLARKEKLPAAA